MGGIFFRIRQWWDQAEASQRLITVGGAAFFAFLLFGTFYFASRPKFVPLYTGLDETEKSSVVTELTNAGIPVQYGSPGMIEVPEGRTEDANVLLAKNQKLPKTGHLGSDALQGMTIMSTPAVERERLKGIAQDELEKTIEKMDNIQAARVHITLADPSAFADDKKPATASVSLTESPGAHISPTQGEAIASLVAHAVDGLDMKDVTILNQSMEFVYNGQDRDSSRSGAETKNEMEDKIAHRRARQLQDALDMAFGPRTTIVTVHCELDLDRQSSVADIRKPSSDPIQTEKSTEEMNGAAKPLAMGITGLNSNNASQPRSVDSTATGSGSSYKNKTVTEDHLINETQENVEKAPGTVKSMVINVLADSKKIPDTAPLKTYLAQDVAQYQNSASFVTNVTAVPFDTTSQTAAQQEAASAATQSRIQQLISLLPVLAMLGIAFLIVKQVGKFANSSQMSPLSIGGSGNYSLPEHGTAVQNPEALTNLLAALEPGGGQGGVLYTAHEDNNVVVEAIKDKVHLPLEQLKRMATERPAMVSMLIKSMLLEDRK